MNRTQAMMPVVAGEARFNLTAGALLRGTVRLSAAKAGVDYYEEKGLLESVFIFRGEIDRVKALYVFFKKNLDT